MNSIQARSQLKFGEDDVDEADEDVVHQYLHIQKKYEMGPHKDLMKTDMDEEEPAQVDHSQIQKSLHFIASEDMDHEWGVIL